MNHYTKFVALMGISALSLNASGWRIPEQSLNATALSAAYVANAHGADASYYNPANMVWNDNVSQIEFAFTYIGLSSINYKDDSTSSYDGESETESFYVPTFHYTSPFVGDFRFGLSLVAPGGLSKRWTSSYAKTTAEEFTLKILELNPTVAYKINDDLSVGFGLRAVYIDGIVKSEGTIASGVTASRDMEGDSIDYGYNLALSYKPIENLTLSTTYRSKVDLTVEGNSELNVNVSSSGYSGSASYDGDASITIPLPASLVLAAAYTMDKTTVELTFERTYWSEYKDLDFNYSGTFTSSGVLGSNALSALTQAFDNAQERNWEDVNAYRIGITHKYNDKLTLMAGFAYDESGAPESTVGFELPESNARLYSIGFDYRITKNFNVGMAYLYDQKESRTINQDDGITGEFTDASAQLVTISLKYQF